MIDLNEIFKSSEKVNVEVKAAQGGIPNSVWETYSSFANTFGGTIVLGIGEDKETKKFIPVGLSEPQKMLSDIWNVLNNRQKVSANILLEDQVYVLEHDGLNYIVMEIPRADRRDKPIFVGTDMFRGTFKRNHEGDYHCTKEDIKAMLRDQSDTSADSLVLDKVGIDTLNADSIKSYRARFKSIREEHVWNKLPTDQFLIKIGAAKISDVDGKIHPTLGGLIFFGDFIDITYELPNFFLDYRERMSNETRWSDRVCSGDGDWSGNVFDFYYRIIDRLTADVKRPFQLDDKLTRIDDTPIHKGLRECLANALIHADYYGRRGIVIDKEFRKITISNPGTFRIDVSEAIAGGISDARNSKIFNMFSLINVGERSGIGLCDVYSAWKANGYKEPEFVEAVDPDRITLTLQIECVNADDGNGAKNGAKARESDSVGVKNGVKNGVKVGVKNGSKKIDELSENENLILNLLRENPKMTTTMLSDATDIPSRTVQRHLKALKENGWLVREGSNTKGEWIVLLNSEAK